ncbi:MAG: leucine-rich repeat domain-containing protein, partial [Clostridia bacterium]|nr:leucine-rich repeat domain-containing protein [Clostridia bacterium]
MKKKILICALLSAAAVSATAFAGCNLFGGGGGDDKTVYQDNMRFELKEDGTYELERYEYAYLEDREDRDGNFVPGYSGDGETVNVPETVNGKAVTSVAGYAFCGTGVKSVTLPDAISVLPDRIFESCSLLTTVNYSTVTSVGELAFYECVKLTGIEFKSGLTEIGDRAFGGCAALATVTLPDTVTAIGENCFYECPFESINTAGVESIGAGAFYKCENITALNLSNVVSIGEGALRFCNSMTEITIGNKLESIGERPFVDNPALEKVSINSPVPAKMFMWNKTVTEVALGEGVTSIGESAFAYCSGVTEITLPATLTEIGENAFSQSGLTGAVTISSSVKTIGENAFYGCGLTELTIENGIESIGAAAFERTAITSLSLPASVKTVGDKAFAACNMCTGITLANGLESIGSYAFSVSGDEAMEIVLPSTVKSLGDGCFAGIAAKKLIINDTVETVGENILKGCRVRELTVPATYGHNAAAVEKLTLFGEGEIPANAYQKVTTLKTVDLGGGVKKIGYDAFNALETINLAGVEYMGNNALGNLSTLTCLNIENGLKTLDGWVIAADYSNGGATTLDLSGYTGIYNNAFAKTDTNDTSVLNTVVLVGSDNTSKLKFIGARAFAGSGITAVEVPAGIQNWNYAFYGCKSLLNIAIQSGVEKIADNAFR